MLVYLPPNLGVILKAASDNGTAKWGATTGVRVISKDGIYRVETTDGRRLLCVQGPNEDKNWPNMESIPEWEGEALVPAEDWETVFKLAAAQAKDGDIRMMPMMQGVAIGTPDKDSLLLATFKTVTQAKQLDGRFPNTDRVWDNDCKQPVRDVVKVDPDYLIETLQVFKQLAARDAMGVDILFRGQSKPIGLTITNMETGQVADAVVLPLLPTNKKTG